MPLWTVELDDGRTIELEHDTEPTESEVYHALAAQDKSSEEMARINKSIESSPAYLTAQSGGRSWLQADPEGFAPVVAAGYGLIGGAGELAGKGLHAVMAPIEWTASRLINMLGGAMSPNLIAMGQAPGTTEPGKSVIPGLEPPPEAQGVIPSLRRAGAGLTTPGSIATFPVALESKLLRGGLAAATAAQIPASLLQYTEAKTPEAARGALTDAALQSAFTALLSRGPKKKGATNARNIPEATEVYADVPPLSRQGAREVPIEEGGAGVQPARSGTQAEQSQAAPDPALLDATIAELNAKRKEQGYLTTREQEALKLARRHRDTLVSEQFDMPAEDKAFIDAERESIDVPIEAVPDVAGPDDPFAGNFMRANRAKQRIEIFPREFSAWLNEDLAGLTPEQKQVAVRTRLAEERIHLTVDDAAASTFWDNLTGVEKKIFERIYLGQSKRGSLSDTMMGHEALRYRIQQLNKMTPSELAESIGRERWTLKGLAIVESAIRGIRSAMRTKARSAQAEIENTILDRVQNKIEFARGILTGQDPAAMRRDWGSEEERAARAEAFKGTWSSDQPSQAKAMSPSFNEYNRQKALEARLADVARYEDLKAMIKAAPTFEEKFEIQKDIEALKNKYGGMPPTAEAPAAKRRGISQRSQREIEAYQKLMAARLADQGEEIPPHLQEPKYGGEEVPLAERVGAEESGALPRLSPRDVESKAKQFIESEITPEPLTKGQRESSKLPRPKYDRASFDKFMDWGQRNLGKDVQPEQLRDIWIDNVWSHVLNASGERLAEWRQALRLEGAFGKRSIVDSPTSPEAEATLFPGTAESPKSIGTKENRAFAESQIRYRNKVISAVARKLVNESVRGRAALDRADIGVEDIAFNNSKSRYGAYRAIRSDEAGRPELLNSILRDQARATEADPESASRRLVLLRDKRTGQVHMVSTYSDAGRQMVTDPAGPRVKGQFSRVLDSSLLKQYEPIATVLLKEPVRAFRRTFESPAEFAELIGKEAENRSSVGEDFVTEQANPESTIEGTPGLEGEGGMIQGPGSSEARALLGMNRGTLEGGRNMTPAEAGGIFNHIEAEAGQFDTVDDVRRSLMGLADAATRKKLTGSDRLAISGYRKAFEHLESRFPEMSYEELVDVLAKRIYDNHATSKTYDTFIDKTLAEFEAENPRVSETEPRPSETARELSIRNRTEQANRQEIFGGKTGLRGYREIEEAGIPERLGGQERLAEQILSSEPETPSQSALREQAAPEPLTGQAPSAQETVEFQERLARRHAESVQERNQFSAELRDLIDGGEGRSDRANRLRQRIAKIDREFPVAAEAEREMPGARRRKQRSITGLAQHAVENVGSLYDEWMADRIGRVGGPNAQAASEGFKLIIDRAKELYGSLTPNLDKARSLAGGTRDVRVVGAVPSPKAIRAAHWLHGFGKEWTPFAATSRTAMAIEGKYWSPKDGRNRPFSVPTHVTPTVDAAKQANFDAGRMAASATAGSKATGKFERHLTPLGFDVIQARGGEMWRKLIAGNYQANKGIMVSEYDPATQTTAMRPIQPRDVRRLFTALGDAINEPQLDMAKIDKINQDFARFLPNVITHIKDQGRWQELVHSDLFNYLENSAQRAAHIKAFREQFPNDPQGRALLASVTDNVSRELENSGHKQDFVAMLKSLQGQPTDSYANGSLNRMLGPTTGVGGALRLANQTVGNLFSKLALTGQMFVQSPETVAGATPVFLGYKNLIRGMARLRDGTLYKQMEQTGDVNRVMYDFTFNPRSPVRSAFRLAGNVISKGFGEQMLNELQEASAAATARVVSERITNGQLSKWEKRMLPQTFKAMGFTDADVAAMMQGDPTTLAQFQRKAAAFLTGGNKAIAEGSKIGSNRLFNSIFRFQLYPMTKMNQFRRVTSNMLEAWDKGTNKRAATEQFARFMFGTAAQGAMVSGIASLMFGGKLGLNIWGNEAKDEPMKFLAESFLASMGGPLYLAWRGARSAGLGGIGEQATRTAFPYSLAREMLDMANGAGQYKDSNWFNRIGKFLLKRTPGAKAIGTGLAAFGLSEDNAPLDTAMTALNRWKINEHGLEVSQRIGPEAEGKRFRMAMKRAVEALKDGNQEKYQEAVAEAATEKAAKGTKKSWQDIAASLRGRKALTLDGKPMSADQIEQLRERIGSEAVELLQNYDGMLEAIAGTGRFVPVAK